MGKITAPNDMTKVEEQEDFFRFVSQWIKQAQTVIMGQLTWGENIQAKVLTVSFPAPGALVEIKHSLGYIPSGFLQAGADTDALAYGLPDTSWTGEVIYLRANKAAAVKLIIF